MSKRRAEKAVSILPMQLRVGEIASHSYTIGGGKVVHVRVQKVGEPAVTEERSWGAHKQVAVRRA